VAGAIEQVDDVWFLFFSASRVARQFEATPFFLSSPLSRWWLFRWSGVEGFQVTMQ
jgi:hypothetical protein